MADTEVLKKLKDIPFKIQTASLKGRCEVLKEIQDVLSTPGITEPAVKFVCRVLLLTLNRYRDSTSQSYIKNLLAYLAKDHKDWTLKTLLPSLLEVSDHLKCTASSKSTCQTGLYALRWTTVLVEGTLKAEEDGIDYNTLVLTQANLLAVVTAYGNKKKNDKGYSVLHNSWKLMGSEKLSKWMNVLLSQSVDSGPQLCVTYSALCKHAKQTGSEEIILQHKGKMLESLIKSLITVKTRPNANYIRGCSDLLHLLQLSDVQDTLLPALQKAMLRSPETIIQAVGEIVANLDVYIDGIAVDIGKSLIVNLHSRDEWVRSEARAALGAICRRCCAAEAARALLVHAFAHYNGANGKLSSSEDKIAVLNGVSTLSELSVTQEERMKLFDEVTTQISKVLESESHERTLCVALEALYKWIQSLDTPLSDKILQIYKKGLSAKSTTQAVRIAYTSLVARGVRAARGAPSVAFAAALRPTLLAAVDRAVSQPLQHLVVSEGICAMAALAQLDGERALPETPAWAALAHPQKHVLLHDRVLGAASDDVLIQVVSLCRTVLDKYESVASDQDSPVLKAFILVLLSPIKSVRSVALEEVKSLLASENKASLAKRMVMKLNEVLDDGKIFTVKEKTPPEDKAEVTGKMILDCVHALCAYRDYRREDLESLALEALPCCHQPLAVAVSQRAWLKLVAYLRLDPHRLVAINLNKLKNIYITNFTPNETTCNVVSTLVRCSAEGAGGAALLAALEALQQPALLSVSRDDYFVYLTPSGHLYDKSVVPGSEENKEMNLKRESKAYSYKEQLEELQLRRELDEKRRKEGKIKEVPLTAKQKDAIKAQLAKEGAIRERLTELNSEVEKAVALIEATARGSAVALGTRARSVLRALLAALRSPLAAPRVAPAHYRLRLVLLPRHALLADHVARTTIRLFKPQCDLDPSWEEEELGKATVRTINLVHAAVSSVLGGGQEGGEADAPKQNHLTAPGFCYVFPLLKQGLSSSVARSNEAMVLNGLAVIAQHAALHGDVTSLFAPDQLHPQLFPIDQMFRLLIDLISSSSGRVTAACTVALLETARCAARAPLSEDDVVCLLDGLQNPVEVVRDAALRALLCVVECLPPFLEEHEFALTLTMRLYIATFDDSEENKKLASELWDQLPRAESWTVNAAEELRALLLQQVQHPSEPVQTAAARALAALVARAPQPQIVADEVLQSLHQIYDEKLPLIPAVLDQFGHEQHAAVDAWGARRGVAAALRALAPCLAPEAVPAAMAFFVQRALADRNDSVRDTMLAAAMALVDLHGKATLSSQLPVFEQFLDTAPKSGGYDAVRQCVVLLVGSLARHLAPDDARVRPITLRLVAALNTPSQQVQEAVSNCLPHLVTSPALEADIPTIVNKLLKQLLTAEKYGDRKGAAYGIAGIIKGLGILSLKQLDVMGKLTEAIQEKKNYKYREGALFGFEMLCCKLGRLFEPYIVHVLPHLLLCFGDSSQYVRTAADDTAKLIMSRLSAHGVKLVLPSLLQALQDDNWRTKAGSIELLGAMAYCAPKQLSSCLPSIVPKLIEVLSDSHMRVQEAGAEALKVIGSVIRNPEIQAIVPVLLQALQDPSNKTSLCLQTLLDTKFVHFIDAPSLALIMPVVERAFLDRSTETRKMAAQIIGNMYSLTDQKDLTPYLPSIIPGLKSSLLDPVPEVRSVSARALGAMVRGMGENSFEELLPWLMQTLTSESSSVDRSGAAQGLSEVVAGLGSHKLHKIMPDIIATAERTDIAPHVKDGYIMMFIYMPGAFTDEFTPYIGQIINPILKALADENEYVRETALKAGQRIVNLYAESAITLLLPELEKGLFDDNWRIRYSSVQLLGDLLYRISGVSGKMSTETASEDDNFGTEHSHKAIITALGPERRNRVLAGLYMGRSDVALMVRQAALHVWKVVVTNTPKTLREILPTLFNLLLGCLASTSYDKRQVAARTLGDLVRKLGERVLPDIVPILERGLKSERADQRQGVCIGLGEILASTSRDAVLGFADGLVPTVRTALCDELPEVRMAAARAFDSLHATIGNKALDDILPPMLDSLRHSDPNVAEAALDGLKQVMAIKSRAVLPYLVPVLTGGGGGAVDTRALSALAAAAGSALARHLPRVLPALLAALVAARGSPHEVRELEYCRDALLPVQDDAGVRSIIDTLMEYVRTGEGERRRAAAALLCAFVTHTRADLIPHVPALLRGLLLLFAETERDVLLMAWEALSALTKMLEAEKQLAYVQEVRQAVRYAAADLKGEPLPGFCLPKGIAPILPLFREAILNGLPEEKENAALMLGEVIKLTTASAIQPSVVHITGPLIRILGDRFNSSVKAAVLETLALLLSKVGVMLKQFLPQLQTTFVKGLSDANRSVRIKAGLALSQLVLIHTRADPLFLEVHNGVKNAEDIAVKETMLQALRSVITNGGDKMSEQTALTVLAMLTCPALLAHPEDPPRGGAGGCLGALLHCLPSAHLDAALLHHVLAAGHSAHSGAQDDWLLAHGRSCALFVALKETPQHVYRDQFEEKIDKALLAYLTSDKAPIVSNGIRGIGYLICYLLKNDRPVPPNILSQFVRSMNHSNNEVKQLMARASTLIGRSGELRATGAGADVLRALLPALVNGTKEKNTYVRANSEIALRAVLRLPQDETFHQQCMSLLEEGGREALGDVVTRVLRRTVADGRDEDLDCTLIT